MVIGNVELGPEASVWPYAVLRGDDGLIRIGARSNVQDNAVIHCTPNHPTVIGDDCTIGHQAHLEGCTVHDDSLIGVGAVVIHDARIGPPRPGGGQRDRDRRDGGAAARHGAGNPGPDPRERGRARPQTSRTPTSTPGGATTTGPSRAVSTDRKPATVARLPE